MSKNDIGIEMYSWLCDLFPINRSITGPGNRETLKYLKKLIKNLQIYSVPSGTKAYDWVIPDEWIVNEAYILDEEGNEVINFKNNNLHLVGYSEPVNLELTLDELQTRLYSLPENPNAVPYVTSYYNKTWGFCISDQQRKLLKNCIYRVVVDSSFVKGCLNYGECLLVGNSEKEVLLSTYICHPSMANNELSGPVVATALTRWLQSLKSRRYSYRIIFIPETIGAIYYISKNKEYLRQNTIAGFQITCVGDNNNYSFLPSRNGNTFSDKYAQHVLKHIDKNYLKYSFLDRGSDERQFCSPGVDLPIASIMRSKYGEYDEYHTSLDNLNFVSEEGLSGGFFALKKAIEILETDFIPITTNICEPQLGKRGLYPTFSTKEQRSNTTKNLMNILVYSDGTNTLFDIAEILNIPYWIALDFSKILLEQNLIRILN